MSSFQLNKIGMISKLFDTIKAALVHAGRTMNDINIDSKIVAWSCYTIVNICTNCIPNILLLRGTIHEKMSKKNSLFFVHFLLEMIPTELDSLNEAMQLEIWSCIWQENYAQIILQFADEEIASHLISNAVQPKQNLLENTDNHIEHLSIHRPLSTRNHQRCTIL